MPAEEILLYPRHWQEPTTGRIVDASAVIARFLVGQPFTLKSSEGTRRYRITLINREGIWGTPDETEQQP